MRRVSKLDNGTEKSLERWSERKIDSVDVGGRLLEASAGGLLVGGKLLAGWGAPDSVRTRFRTLAHCEAEAQVEMWDAGGTVELRACGSGQGGFAGWLERLQVGFAVLRFGPFGDRWRRFLSCCRLSAS